MAIGTAPEQDAIKAGGGIVSLNACKQFNILLKEVHLVN